MPPSLLQCPQGNSESAWKDTKVLSPAYAFFFNALLCFYQNIKRDIFFFGLIPARESHRVFERVFPVPLKLSATSGSFH